MSKAILVMDMPASCSKCNFLYEFQGIKKCLLMNVLYGGASMLSQNNFTVGRHEKCPLHEMPEKKEKGHSLKIAIENDCYDGTTEDKAYCDGWDKGYNACINEILRGSGENGRSD